MDRFSFRDFRIFFVFFFIFSVNLIYGQSIKGIVLDSKTGEPMVGANAILKGTNYKQFVKLDGTFHFKNLKSGIYVLEISYATYQTYLQQIEISGKKNADLSINLKPQVAELSTVTVSAGNNSSEKSTRGIEKNANQLVNIMSAKSIQLLPDINVANVLQRVSGVTIEKSGSGEARYPIIRGMEKRYINTLVNGIKIPSPDNKNRFVPLDLFPSELLERLEVVKSLTPNMEGDAIGGTINLVMKDAPTTKLLHANISLGYNSIFQNETYQHFNKSSIELKSPFEKDAKYVATPSDFSVGHLNYTPKNNPVNSTFGITYGDRFGKHRKLGIILSASFQDIYRGTTSNFFLPNSQPGLNNIPLFSNLQLRKYSVESIRTGINAKFDYLLNSRNKISYTNTFVNLSDFQTRIVYDTVALNSLVNNWQRSTWQYQSIENNSLQGIHKLSNSLQLDWNTVYSFANNHMPDQAQFTHQYAIVSTTLTTDKLQDMTRRWSHNSDKDFAGYLNITKNAFLFKKALEWKIGGLIRNKERDNFYISYSLNPQLNSVYSNINQAVFLFNPLSDGLPSLNGNNYTFSEKIKAAYVQFKFEFNKNLELLGGARYEQTNQSYNTALSASVDAKSGSIKYNDLLPSFQLKYALTKQQQLRLSYYRALARPGFAELIPDGPDGEFFKEVGDPKNLQHTIADNLDLRYEFYATNADQVLLGVFYKNIQDPIEISAVKPLNINNLYLQPVNIGNATNYGFEAVLSKYFGYFGISANYTYTKSAITNDSLIYSSRNAAGAIVSTRVSETRPLQGQSNHIGNLSLIYKNPKIGLDFQAALVYTGERISFISPYIGLNYWQSPTTQLDLSFEKKIVNKLTFYGKINNLTNTPYELSLHQSYLNYMKSSGSRALAFQSDPGNRIIIQKDFYKTSFLFGLRYKF